jgi:protein gp37
MTTKIEWARNADGSRGETWNPTTGCDRVSEGCRACYALTLAARLKAMGQAKYQRDGDPRTSGPGFGLSLHPDVLDIPLRRKKPTTWFVDSMSDLFHPEVPKDFIAKVFAVMAATPAHTYQVLTKRPQRMADLVADGRFRRRVQGCESEDVLVPVVSRAWPLPNVWLGASIESDAYTWRTDHLRRTPAAVRFLSLEPLLGPVPSLHLDGIHWVIAGGESGPRARPIDSDWVRDIRDRCVEAEVPLFVKQMGSRYGRHHHDPDTWPEDLRVRDMPEQCRAVA